MKIFKNEVGRPSKEKVATRRMYMATFIVSCFAIVLSIIAILNSNFNFIKLSGAAANTCKFPYTYKKCNGKANDTVKKVQELLKNKICTSKGKKVACYSDKTDGKFGSKTKTAVTNFQKAQGITQDGNLGYDTLTRLAKVTKTRYFVIEYDKAGSSTALSGTQTLTSKSKKKYVQAFIYGVTSQISDTKLTKSGYEHVGYTIESTYNGITYRYGCFDKNCKTGNWYDNALIHKKQNEGEIFYPNVYSIGTKVSRTGQIGDGQVVKFTAKYCKSGEEYDKTKSSCVKAKNEAIISDSAMKFYAGVIFAETGNKEKGQRAVGYVIKNRMGKKLTTNKLLEVLTARGQFTTVKKNKTGNFNYSYKYNGKTYYTKKYTELSLKTAKAVMNGNASNPIGTRKFFWEDDYYISYMKNKNREYNPKNPITIDGNTFFNM